MGRDGFAAKPMTTRAVEKLIGRYVEALGLDPNVTVHSLRVTALTTARERGIGHHRLAGFRMLWRSLHNRRYAQTFVMRGSLTKCSQFRPEAFVLST